MKDPRNRIPETVRTVHLIAVCGTAMGALAAMLKDLGMSVTGSDRNVYPPMSTFLADRGIPVADGFSAAHLAHRPDLVVVGNAVTRDNPEAEAMRRLDLHFCSMPQALNHFAARGKRAVVVTGTHGKTTTSALAAWVLASAGRDPSFVVGGILNNFHGNYRLGAGDAIVLEGDEYDTAYFDKGAKFLHYTPAVAVVTGVEFDHADIFRDLAHVKDAFRGFISGMPPDSTLLVWDGDPEAAEPAGTCPGRVETYGRNPASVWQADRVRVQPPYTMFRVLRNGEVQGEFASRLMGGHNLANTLAVIGAAHHLGVGCAAVAEALETFAGVRRRQEVRGVVRGITVMDDFAHHPTAVRETLRAVRPFYPNGRLLAVFEPRTNTSMRNVFQTVYPEAFDAADAVWIRRPPLLEKIPEDQRFSSERLVRDLTARGKEARFFSDTDGIVAHLSRTARPGDLILVMSNGGFDNIHLRLLEALESGGRQPPGPPVSRKNS